jgi:hypothetical protein
MAKLYITAESEKTERHLIANRTLDVRIFYGSREDSKLLCHLVIEPTTEKPKFFFFSDVQPAKITLPKKVIDIEQI